MDIAKIRKKLKGSKEQEPLSSGPKEKPPVTQGFQREKEVSPLHESEVISHESPVTADRAVSEDTALSSPPPSDLEVRQGESAPLNLLVFKLAGEEYAFLLEDVKEILKKQYITAVPLAPYSVVGITSLRGTVIPVIDLSMKLLGIPSRRDRKSRIIIMEGEKGIIGCIVDEIEGVLRSGEDQKRTPPEEMADKERAFIDAIFLSGERFITLLKKEVIEITDSGGR